MAHVERRPRARSGKVWRARYRTPDGREHSKSFGVRRDAEQFLARTVASLATGSYVDPAAGRQRFGEYAESGSWVHRGPSAARRSRIDGFRLFRGLVVMSQPVRRIL